MTIYVRVTHMTDMKTVIKELLWMFMTVVSKRLFCQLCPFKVKLTWFQMALLSQLDNLSHFQPQRVTHAPTIWIQRH